MAKKITPKAVATQFGWAIEDIRDFCADAMENANDHNIAAALRAINVEEYDLASQFIQIEKEHRAAGHLTKELYDRRNELLDRLGRAARG